jgi:hypothetical protein
VSTDGEITSIIGPGWAGNMTLDALTDALRLNADSTPTVQGDDNERYWASQARFADSDTSEVMEWDLNGLQLVNHISFDVCKFPCDVDLEYCDDADGRWYPMHHIDYDGDEPCRAEILDCYPAVIPAQGILPGEYHPQHSWPDHWNSHEWTCRPVRSRRLRLVLKRHRRSRLPCDTRGVFVAYSLAVRKLYCGYKVDRRDCVPRPVAVVDSVVEHEEIATATDLLGSSISYSIRINRARNVLLNKANTGNPTESIDAAQIWRSEPQPFPWAVVNYYLDIRDAQGAAQTLDRIFLDPTNDGAHVNLYYSNDEPDTVFEGPDDLLPSNVAVINGQFGEHALSEPDLPVGTPCYVDIDNGPICFRPRRRWWFGCRTRWRFRRHDDVNDHPLFDCGDFHLSWTRFGLRFATRHGDFCYVDCDDFDPGTDFDFVCWHDGDRVRIRIRCREKDFYGECPLTVRFDDHLPERLRFCRFFDRNDTADCNLRHCVLKCDEDWDYDRCDRFFREPHIYVIKPEFRHDDSGGTDNAILRYFPDFAKTGFPSGFKGGDANRYADMEWSPIARDFILRRGFLQFPPTKAKYWKLEFCDLVPEPYEVYVPIKRTVQTFRTEMWLQPTRARTITSRMSDLVPGVLSQMNLSSIYRYLDNANLTIGSGAQPAVTGATVTSARIVLDQSAVNALRRASWSWCFTPCHPMSYVPRFETKCVHSYTEIDVEQTTKIAYFVGLKAVQPYKVDYLSVDDTNQYWELFTDDHNIATDTGWVLTADHRLTSGDAQFAQAESKVLPSQRVVRAVQFASTQSGPRQLLPDDDFDDTDHEHWTPVGDGSLAAATAQTVAVGSTLRVDRASRVFSWDELIEVYPTWNAIVDDGATWTELEGIGNPAQAVGGIESAVVDTPPGGRIYAAARVIAPAALTAPLYVQIVDAENNRVLAETAADVQANQITEWWTGYTLGEGGDVLAWRWADFATNAVRPVTLSDNFARVNGPLGKLTTGQSWTTGQSYDAHTIVSGKAHASSGISYDYVDTISPWGSLQVTLGTTTAGYYLFECGPFWISDAGYLGYRSNEQVAVLVTNVFGRTLVAGDSVQIDVLPTSAVPAGKKDTLYPSDAVQAPVLADVLAERDVDPHDLAPPRRHPPDRPARRARSGVQLVRLDPLQSRAADQPVDRAAPHPGLRLLRRHGRHLDLGLPAGAGVGGGRGVEQHLGGRDADGQGEQLEDDRRDRFLVRLAHRLRAPCRDRGPGDERAARERGGARRGRPGVPDRRGAAGAQRAHSGHGHPRRGERQQLHRGQLPGHRGGALRGARWGQPDPVPEDAGLPHRRHAAWDLPDRGGPARPVGGYQARTVRGRLHLGAGRRREPAAAALGEDRRPAQHQLHRLGLEPGRVDGVGGLQRAHLGRGQPPGHRHL